MQIKTLAEIHSGYLSRGKIEARKNGTHFLFQAKDVDSKTLTYKTDDMVRFKPVLSSKDIELQKHDILFMSRGSTNYSIILKDMPENVLAAACYFVVRVKSDSLLPGYLFWYLNQNPVEIFLKQYSGRGVHMPVVRRAVLENINIPLPPVESQKKIIELNDLMREEQNLLDRLAEKRRQMITAACLQSANQKP